ncbi:MAG: pyruvate dehydrogenase (acetyl-transferring) E1 component subunit alpha [Deltaproteobacteria bacterium]|nr:pyruvate dehydrogenase (acetyl-transferring) E1 component subunit alpha [Deltaproteobacteria bacterium]
MPRGKIELGSVETLSILDCKGTVDEGLMPLLDNKTLLKAYRLMLLGRRLDEQAMRYQRQGRIGTFAPNIGQEAAQVGAGLAMKKEDWFAPSFRELGVWLARGMTIKNYFLGWMGIEDGNSGLKGTANVPVAVPVATQCTYAAGIAWGIKLDKKKAACVVFFGDGATSEGSFHEGINFCGAMNLPAVYFCQNNQWAISTPRKKQTKSETIAQKAIAYGIHGIQVDGNDFFSVYVASIEALKRAYEGKGPTLVEAITYRRSVHTTADDPRVYRSEKEEKEWDEKDPIHRMRSYLEKKKILTKEDNEKLEAVIAAEIKAGYVEAEAYRNSNIDPLSYFDYIYKEIPPYLKWQKEIARHHLKGRNVIKGATEPVKGTGGAAAVGQLEEAED